MDPGMVGIDPHGDRRRRARTASEEKKQNKEKGKRSRSLHGGFGSMNWPDCRARGIGCQSSARRRAGNI